MGLCNNGGVGGDWGIMSHLRTSSGGWFHIKKTSLREAILFCDPGGIQTRDLQIRNLTFYSAELRDRSHFYAIVINKPESDDPE